MSIKKITERVYPLPQYFPIITILTSNASLLPWLPLSFSVFSLFKVTYLYKHPSPPHYYRLRSNLWAALTYMQGWKAWNMASEGDGILTQSNDFGT